MHGQDHIEKKGANFWEKHVEQYQQSKQSSKYCQQHNLTYYCFIYWSSTLTSDSVQSDVASSLIAVTLSSPCNKNADVASITLPNGIKFVIHQENTLPNLIKQLA